MILVNGRETEHVPADDRGLAYGDGVFETLRARRGRLPLLDEHLQRLGAGLDALGIPRPDDETVRTELRLAARTQPEGVVKLIVTRGSGTRGYSAPANAVPRRIVQAMPEPAGLVARRRDGVAVIVCRTPLEGPAALAGLKHLNRLPQVLARAELTGTDADEGLMRDVSGNIAEAIAANVFAVIDNVLITPPVGAGVRGVMRNFVIELARAAGIAVREAGLVDAEIETADELFLTNSVGGVVPVRAVGKREYRIGTMTRRLQAVTDEALEQRACSGN